MGDLSKSPNYHKVLEIPKTASLSDITKAYKRLVMKWHPDKHTTNKAKAEAEAKFKSINEAYKALSSEKREEELLASVQKREEELFASVQKTKNKFKTPKDDKDFVISNPTLLSRTRSYVVPESFSTSGSRRSKTPTAEDFYASLASTASGIAGNVYPNEGHSSSCLPKTRNQRSTSSPKERPSLAKATSPGIGSTPIIFSHSTTAARMKPSPIERKLECTLEELCHGHDKKIKITRNVISKDGLIVKEEEILKIRVKPGWKKGTKITFEGKGDERPGTLPADIIFIIDEKRHHLFKRQGNDLELGVEIPLVQALTGCTIDVPLLGGDKLNLSLDDGIIYPGYEKVIPGYGMPIPKTEGKRGDMRLKFMIKFPSELSNEQRTDIRSILEDST